MTPDQRKQLEEMAKTHATDDRLVIPYTRLMDTSFMAGAQAAWDMATKTERERCARLALSQVDNIEISEASEPFLEQSCAAHKIRQLILNPTPRIDGTEERES